MLTRLIDEIWYSAFRLDQLIDEQQNDTKCFCDSCPPHKRGLNIKLALVKFVKVIRKY